MSLPLSTIGTGATANDATGDTVRAAFTKVNDNFTTLNTAVSSLQSNAVTAATIVSLNLTGNLVANNVTANANITVGTIQVSTGIVATAVSPAPVISGFSSISTAGSPGNITASGNLVTSRNAYVTGSIYGNTITVTSAIQFANLTTSQVSNISSPSAGMTVYNYTSGNIQVYNGTKWANITLS